MNTKTILFQNNQSYNNNLNQQMRRVLSQIFTRPNEIFEKYMSKDFNIDSRKLPLDLLEQLKSKKQLKKFIFLMNQREKNQFKLLKKLTLIHLCLVYSADFCDSFKKIDIKIVSQESWLNTNIIKPYWHFLSKLCYSEQLYKQVQTNKVVQFTLDNLFFVLKLMKDLFQCSKKLSCLHHYYHQQSLAYYPFLLDNYVLLVAYHAQQIYAIFKAILGEFIRFPKTFINSEQTQKIMKFILQVELSKVNDEMRQIFLNKFFYPYGKGYGIKLFKVQDLPNQTRDYAQSILYARPIKQKKKKITFDSILFDKTGKLNSSIYQGLQQITFGQSKYRQLIQTKLNVIRQKRDYSQHIQSV